MMMYARSSLADYDDWAELSGDDTWNAANLKQYVLKHQTLENEDYVSVEKRSNLTGEHHGKAGPIRTSFNSEPPSDLEDAFLKSASTVSKTSRPKDAWSGDHIGFYNTLGAVARSGPNKGKRSYAAREYLQTAADRPNLSILTEATVKEIKLKSDNSTAEGIAFLHGGQEHHVEAKREVIVSCGALQSPQVLELSGIGRRDVLEAAGVPVKVENSEIGENFQDHVLTGIGYQVAPGIMTGDILAIPEVLQQTQKQYMETQAGPMSSTGSVHGFLPYKSMASAQELEQTVATIKSAISSAKSAFQRAQLEKVLTHIQDSNSANIQFVLLPVRFNPDAGLLDQSKLFGPQQTPKLDGPMYMGIGTMLQYPTNRGTCHIRSSNVHDHPTIDPGYIANEVDVDILAAAVRLLDTIMHDSHIQPFISKRYFPPPERDLQDMQQSRELVRSFALGEYHCCGTVALGAALDADLKVKGTSNIRVIDASIFPNHVSGNISSSVYTIAEKGADIIKQAVAAK